MTRPLLMAMALFLPLTAVFPSISFAQNDGQLHHDDEAIVLDVHPAAFIDKFTLTFDLAEPDTFVVGIYDRKNRQVRRVSLGALEEGRHSVTIRGADWSAGPHLVILTGESGRKGSTNVVKIQQGPTTPGFTGGSAPGLR